PISIKHYKTTRCYYSMPFSEARRTLARKKRFSGSLDYRMSKRQTYSFMRDAYSYARKKKTKIKLKKYTYNIIMYNKIFIFTQNLLL
uniref:hypothetical protein n=1 Tax=Parabacteroides distasonis TaxID=823 RepID=UPI003FF001C4